MDLFRDLAPEELDHGAINSPPINLSAALRDDDAHLSPGVETKSR